ncbi:MAG: hypothetical protein V8S24_04425, partial [Gordonibacter pamelaeae]
MLLEDLKVSGLKPGRLREMTKFFYKGIADGESSRHRLAHQRRRAADLGPPHREPLRPVGPFCPWRR